MTSARELAEKRIATMARRNAGQRPSAAALRDLPPGPGWPPVAQMVGMLGFRHRFVPWLQAKYGDVIGVRLPPGGRPIVLHHRPEHVKEIFAGDPAVFHAGKANAILGPVMGEHSLLLVDGEEHKRARKLLMPAFNRHALKAYAGLVRDVTTAELASWPAGTEFRALDRMNALTLEVILRVVYGITSPARLAELRPRVQAVIDVPPHVMVGANFERLRGVGPWKAAIDNQVRLDEILYDQIAEHRAAPDLATRDDVLARLIRVEEDGDRLGDEELRDQLMTLLLAGHETTATALAWALYELGHHPALQARSREAALTGDDEWLEAVLKESMRLHPVIPIVARTLQEPTTVAGRRYPAGVTVAVSVLLAHRQAASFASPEEFQPERFVGRSPAPNTWVPFGGGDRRCIGAVFSMMEGVEVLRQVLTSYDVTSVGLDEPKVRNITSVPKHGARIRVTARTP